MTSTTSTQIITILRSTVLATTLILLFVPVVVSAKGKFEVVYEWKVIDYNWPDPKDREEALKNGDYIPENNLISAVKIWQDRIYLSSPRLLPGVPSTLNWIPWVPPTEEDGDRPLKALTETPLTPFPCLESQKPGDCSSIQNVQGMEIDTLGRMWVLDVGRRNLLTDDPDNKCSPKLVILDLNEEGKLLHVHEFPEEVASRDNSFLNDLVVDASGIPGGTDWFAYIADAGGPPERGGAIVVYDQKNDESWNVIDPKSMSFLPSASTAKIGGRTAMLTFNTDGIALSPVGDGKPLLYYCPLGSFGLYSVPTSVLKRAKNQNIGLFVRDLGRKRSQADGMMMDNMGRLYYGALTKDAVVRVNRKDLLRSNGRRVAEKVILKDRRLEWVDGFGFDLSRQLWFTTNRLQNVQARAVNTSEINYRLNRFNAEAKSYMYPITYL